MNNFWGPGAPTLLFSARSNDTDRDTASILPRGGLLKRLWTGTTPAGAMLATILCFLAVSVSAQPANDNFANAFTITGALGSTTGSNIGATLQTGETNKVIITNPSDPNHGKAVAVSSSVWFQWTNAAAGEATFTTIGSTDQLGNAMSTVLAVWKGSSVSSLTLVASCANTYDDSAPGLSSPNSSVAFLAQPGTTYYVSVDVNAANGGQQGNYVLNWNAQAPVNDDFTNAITLGSATAGSTSGFNINATMESNEPASVYAPDVGGPVTVGNSIWYQWQAPQNGNVTFDTSGSLDELGNPEDTVIAVWQGNNVTNLVFDAADDNVGNLGTNVNSSVTFPATVGQTYDVAVYVNQGAGGLPGDVVLDWAMQTTNTPASGTFQFTSAQYQFSQNEGNTALHASMRALTPGVRATITRIGGADGMADVNYSFTNTLYTNWNTTVIFQSNIMAVVTATNGNILYMTNGITTVYNYTQVYQNYDVINPTNPYTFVPPQYFGYFDQTQVYSALLEESFSNGLLTSIFFTNGLPYVTNLGGILGPQGPVVNFGPPPFTIFTYTNTVINSNAIYADTDPYYINTNEYWAVNTYPVPPPITNQDQSVTTFTESLSYTNLTVTNFVSTWMGNDYPHTQQTAVFNDYQMNYDVLIGAAGVPNFLNVNPLVVMTMTGAQLDPNEDGILPVPQISGTRNTALISLYNNGGIPGYYGNYPSVPYVWGNQADTNNIINFERSTLRCTKDVNGNGGTAYVGVTLTRRQPGTVTVNYRIDYAPNLNENDANDWFTAQAGSDYARPGAPPGDAAYGATPDFGTNGVTQGTLTWNGNDSTPQFIAIPINQDTQVKFNRDISLELYYPGGTTPQSMNGYIGNITTCTLTILMTTPPAGAVDTEYMAENNFYTGDPNDGDPGAYGPVNAVAIQSNGYAVIGGAFDSFDSISGGGVNYIARLDMNGVIDPSFNTLQGFDGSFINESPAVNALAIDTNQNIIAVGQFTSYQNNTASGIARLLPNGNPDPSFSSGYGANSNVWAVALQPNGQIIIGGDFTAYNGTNVNRIARLNPDGSLDMTFSQAGIPNGSVRAIAIDNNGAIDVGGAFGFTDANGETFNNIARLNTDGTVDNTFSNLDAGAAGTVYALAVQTNNLILAGGDFTSMGPANLNYLARLNPDGSVDTNFYSGTGPNDEVRCINLQSDGTFYIGGYFTHYNQTRRVGIARILPSGWVDTTFMDSANNQFAGIPNDYYSDDTKSGFFNGYDSRNAVFAVGVEPVTPPLDEAQTNDVIIGGSFYQVGGDGGLPEDPFTATFDREAPPHVRSNVARLIGGSTPGPGNIGFTQTAYTAGNNNVSQGKFVQIGRQNGTLGVASAYFEPIQEGTGPGYAEQGVHYTFNATFYSSPTFGVSYGYRAPTTWMLQDGVIGFLNDPTSINPGEGPFGNNYPIINIISNSYVGSVSLNMQLASPRAQDTFFLGGDAENSSSAGPSTGFGNPAAAQGENIPLGVGLGLQSAPLLITYSGGPVGQLTFSSSYYYTNKSAAYAILTVNRIGGSAGTPTLKYATGGGTAVAGTDYVPANGTINFGSGSSANIYVQLIPNSTNQSDRVFGVSIFGPSAGASMGPITNADVEIVNNNIASGLAGFVNGNPVSTNVMGYGINENGGVAQLSVARLGGSSGVLQVTVTTSNGSAKSGQNYSFVSTNLVWNDQNLNSPIVQTVKIPILDSGSQSGNLTFNVNLSNEIWGSNPYTNFGAFTIGQVTITNTDLPGTVEFTSPSYTVNENGGSALIPIVRTGGSAGSLSVQVSTVNGTATNGVNFQGGTGIVTFAPGQVSTNLVIGINNQNSPSGLNFQIVMSNPSPANALGTPSVAQVTINGADSISQPPGTPDPTYNAGFNSAVLALALQTDGKLLAGGQFVLADGSPRNYIARLNTDGTLDPTFSSYLSTAGANAPVEAVTIETNGSILIGGIFTNVDNQTAHYVTRLNLNGSLDSGFNTAVGAGANNPVYAIAQTFVGGQSRIVVGGSFTEFNNNQENAIVQLYDGGGVDPSFNASANATVWAVAVQPNGQVIIGGDFTNVDGVAANHIARLNADGSVDYGFTNAISSAVGGANGSVRTITLQLDGRILIGGFFTSVDGVPCNYIARLNSDGSLDASFINASVNPAMGANAPVSTITVESDSRIVVGGQFTQFNGVSRNHANRLNPDGTTDLTINFGSGADGPINASVIQNDGNIVLGGAFTNFDNSLHQNIVRVWGRSVAGSGSFGFSAAGETVSETGFVAPITVVRYGGTAGTNSDGSGDVFVNVITLNNSGTAVPNVNYTPESFLVDFPPGAVEETVDVPIINDITNSPSQWTVGLLLTNPIPASLTINALQNTNTLTILNNSAFISFSSPTYSVLKDVTGGNANINLVRQGYTNSAASVSFSTTTGGTAQPGVMYTPVSPTNVIFNPGVTSVSIPVPIIDDPSYIGNQTVTMALTNTSQGAYLQPPTNATLTIEDLGSTPGQIFFTASNYTFNLSSGYAVVPVLYTNGDKAITVDYYTVDGSATQPANYAYTAGHLDFGNGTVSNSIVVPLNTNNLTPEGPVNFTIVLDNATGGSTILPPTNAIVTINDDISTGVAFVNATNYYEETNGVVSVFVQRLGNTANAFSVSFVTTNGTANSNNYVPNNGTLNFDSGDTLSSIKMTLINNQDVTNVFFGISLLPPGNKAIQLMSPSNTVVVETPAAAGITFASSTNSVFKNAGSITIPVICLGPSNEPAILNSNSVPLSVSFATADGTATAPSDYIATNGVLTFTNGMITNWITVTIVNNSLITGLKNFSVNLFNPQPVPPAKTVPPTNDVITIIDSNVGFEFSSGSYSIDSGGVLTIPVFRVDNTNIGCAVNYATTGGGTAVASNDYIPASGTLSFAPGQTSNSFTVATIGSSSVEPDKTILLQLSGPTPTNGAVLSTPSAATITIYNLYGSFIVPAGVSLPPGSLSNGILQSNQPVELNFGFRDAGGLNVSSMTATLLKTANITPDIQPPQYGAMTVNGHSVFQPVTLTPTGTNGQTVAANFQLTVNSVNTNGQNLVTTQTNSFALTIGSWTTTWSNTNAILFSPNSIASLYPSIITVSNVGGVLVGVTATITNYSDQSPPANEVLLVSPAQLDTLLMAGAGSNQTGIGTVTLTFSNSIPAHYLPSGKGSPAITNGVYNPTQDGIITPFP